MWEVSQLSACQELDRQRLFSCTACTYFFSSMEERQLSISRQHKRWQPLLAAVEILAIVNATTMNQLARVEDGKESFCSWSDTYLQVLNGVSFLFLLDVVYPVWRVLLDYSLMANLDKHYTYNNVRLHVMVWLIYDLILTVLWMLVWLVCPIFTLM